MEPKIDVAARSGVTDTGRRPNPSNATDRHPTPTGTDPDRDGDATPRRSADTPESVNDDDRTALIGR